MANRYIKDTIWTSKNLNNLSPLAERHFYRILMASDDWGCLEISAPVLKGKCYPLKHEVNEADIETWNKELIENNLIQDWVLNDRTYAKFTKFDEHNDALEKHDPKTPCPPWLLKQGIDIRVSDKTSEAFIRIGDAYIKLSNNGHRPNHTEIAAEAHSSKTTVSHYFKKNKHLILGTGGTNDGTVE